MSGQADAQVKFGGDFAEAIKELKGLRGYIEGWGNDVKKIGTAAFAGWAAKAAIGDLVSLFRDLKNEAKSWIEAAAEAEMVDKKLDLAIKGAGDSVGYTTEQLSEYASELENVTTFGDEAIKQAETMLIRMGLTREMLVDTTEASADLAAAMGTDIVDAAALLGRAISYPDRALSMLRRGQVKLTEEAEAHIKVLLKQGKTHEAQAAILDGVKSKYHSTAKEMAGTWTGVSAQISNIIEDIKEALGGGIIDTLKELKQPIKTILIHIQELAEGWRDTMKGMFEGDAAKSGISAIQQGILTLAATIETAFARIPAETEAIFADIMVGIAEMRAAIENTPFIGSKEGLSAAMTSWSKAIDRQGLARTNVEARREGHLVDGQWKKWGDGQGFWGEVQEKVTAMQAKAAKTEATKPKPADVKSDGRERTPWGELVGDTGWRGQGQSQGAIAGAGPGGGMLAMMQPMLTQNAAVLGGFAEMVQNFKEPEKGFSAQILDAKGLFNRQQSAAGSTKDKELTALENILKEAKEKAVKDQAQADILKQIRDKLPAGAVAQ